MKNIRRLMALVMIQNTIHDSTYTLGDHDPGSTSSDLWRPGSESFYLSLGCWTPNSACHQTKLLLGSSDLDPAYSFGDNVTVKVMLMSRVPIL